MILPCPRVLCYSYDISSDGESDNREEIAFIGRELIPECQFEMLELYHVISSSSLTGGFKHMRDIVIDEALHELDKDKDGYVSLEEYISECWCL